MKKIIAVLAAVVVFAVILVTAAYAETYYKGDVDMSGKVNAADARLVLRAGAQIDTLNETEILIADMDNNGKITAMDARSVLRIAAGIDDSSETVTVGGKEEPVERTELSGCISMSIEDFIDDFVDLDASDATDNETVYADEHITVVSDPDMIYTGLINSISIMGGDYTLCGVYTGMYSVDAIALLESDGWTVSSQSSSMASLSKIGMKMQLAFADGKVSLAEYYIGQSLVSDETTTTEPETTTKAPDPTTVNPPETTTNAPETTTKAPDPTTVTPPETTTGNQEIPTLPATGNEKFDALPEQVRGFVLGNFELSGYKYNGSDKNFVSMAVGNGNVKVAMPMTMEDGSKMNISVLVMDANGDSTTYIVSDDTNKYCELSSIMMGLLGIDPEDLDVGFALADIETLEISETKRRENAVTYTVYILKTPTETCEMYCVGEDVKKVLNYDSKGNLTSIMDITSMSAVVTDASFSLSKYSKASTLMGVFDLI